MDSPQVPFFVSWDCADIEHPSAGGRDIHIESIELCGDRGPVDEILVSTTELDDINVVWIEDDEPGISAVIFRTPAGSVRID